MGVRERVENRSGQSLVEFALIAPILILIVVGIIQFGNAWNAYQGITDIAREAARVTVVANGVTQDSVRSLVNRRLALIGLDSATENLSFVPVFNIPSDSMLTVELTYPYRLAWLQPFLSWTAGQASITLKSSATMRGE